MSAPILFDPRLEELMREVASDPRSSLLRVPRPSIVKGLFERGAPVGVAAAGLTLAERELVRRHRAELSKLLREACVMRLFEHPRAGLMLARHHTAKGPIPVAEAGEWRGRVDSALGCARLDEVELSGAELLEECVREPDRVGRASVAQLAAAANRLDPTDEARICAAQELTADGALDTAQRLLLDVLAGPVSDRNSGYAAMDLALVHAQRGESHEALPLYRRAARELDELVLARIGWYVQALFADDPEEARAAANEVDSRLAWDHPGVNEYVTGLAAQRTEGHLLTPTETARAACGRPMGAARRIAHAIASV